MAIATAVPVRSFRGLVEEVAQLSYLNKDHLLFYRGQGRDYRNKAGASTFYPSIYRGERVAREQVTLGLDVLESASARLCDALQARDVESHRDVRRRKYIQWSILQHYEVCATPLLDFTQSLVVACSFAFLGADKEDPVVSVFGLPYITNRVSVNSEHDLVNIRLLSICPPEALRPYFQEGYLAGTDEVTTDYDTKPELDFNNRLIAKFRLVGGSKFWGPTFNPLSREVLYPADDVVDDVCSSLRRDMETGLTPGRVGAFLKEWNELESFVTHRARAERAGDRPVYSFSEALAILRERQVVPYDIAKEVDDLRRLRNQVVHKPLAVEPDAVIRATQEIRGVLTQARTWPDW
ncbi:MAG: FRG domain-containing protein [Actinomycetia bacterium]|nr:FRG domain-containing protein [Actinomycetes bacterium]